MIELEHICRQAEQAAAEAAEFIRKEAGAFDPCKRESKGINNFVSYVDKESEKILVEKLSSILPEAGFLTEEGTVEKSGLRYCWIIDPLDGTTNFLHGLAPYAISIGLTDNDEPVAGVVMEVSGNECFTAWKGGGAWLNGKRIKVSDAATVSESLVATGFPYTDFDRLKRFMGTLEYFCHNSHGIRRFGSAAMDLAYVACGRAELFYEYGLHPWDIAAGMIIVREAGGKMCDFEGNEKSLFNDEVLASNGHVHEEVLAVLKKYMKQG